MKKRTKTLLKLTPLLLMGSLVSTSVVANNVGVNESKTETRFKERRSLTNCGWNKLKTANYKEMLRVVEINLGTINKVVNAGLHTGETTAVIALMNKQASKYHTMIVNLVGSEKSCKHVLEDERLRYDDYIKHNGTGNPQQNMIDSANARISEISVDLAEETSNTLNDIHQITTIMIRLNHLVDGHGYIETSRVDLKAELRLAIDAYKHLSLSSQRKIENDDLASINEHTKSMVVRLKSHIAFITDRISGQ